MKREEKLLKEIRRQCCYLHDEESFIKNVLKPVGQLLPHHAFGVTSIEGEDFSPRSIYYGWPPKYLNDLFSLDIETVPALKQSLQEGARHGYHTVNITPPEMDAASAAPAEMLYKPYGFRFGMQSYAFSEGGTLMGLIGLTTKDDRPYTDDDVKLWDSVTPYIVYAFRKYRWLVNSEFFIKKDAEKMLFAILITDKKGKVIWTSDLALSNFPESTKNNSFQKVIAGERTKLASVEKGEDPMVFREVETLSSAGKVVSFHFDREALRYLPMEGEGTIHFIDCNQHNINMINSLTNREIEILRQIANGRFDKEIACKLDISEKTVNTHTGNLFRKLKVNSRTEAAVKAVKIGIV